MMILYLCPQQPFLLHPASQGCRRSPLQVNLDEKAARRPFPMQLHHYAKSIHLILTTLHRRTFSTSDRIFKTNDI